LARLQFPTEQYAPQPTTSQAPENPAPNGNDNGNGNGILDFNMGLDENAMGLKMEGISFDDLFGNNAAYNPGNMASNDDWTQWMNAGT
jgi:hypothetical protein